MQNFAAIDHFETLDVMPRLHKSAPHNWRGVPERGETGNPMIGLGASLLLRAHKKITKENWLDDLPIEERQELENWPSMKRLLVQASKRIMEEPLGRAHLTGEMGRAMLSRLDPGPPIFWHDDNGPYHERHARFHLPLVTNPNCIMYSGLESLHLAVGSLWYFNNRVSHSAANFGRAYRIHLIFEMRRIEAGHA